VIKIGVGVPAYKGVIAAGQSKMWTHFGASVVKNSGRVQLHAMFDVDQCGIDHARNMIVEASIAGELQWVLMVDSDTWCEPGGALVQMIIDAHEKGAAIVGAPVVMKDGVTANVFRYNEEKILRPIVVEQSREMFEVDGVGGAIIAVNLKKVGDTRFRFTERTGEDLEFCHQLRQRGERVFCDPRIRTLHVDKPGILAYEP